MATRRVPPLALFLAIAMCLLPPSSLAASRARYGGTLKVAVASKPTALDPLWADTPSEAALVALLARPVCRIDRSLGFEPILLSEVARPSPTRLEVTLKPTLRFGNGVKVTSKSVAQSWLRLLEPGAASPYRALLYPLRNEGKQLATAATSDHRLELQLQFPWPDLERSLCHPALSVTDSRTDELRGVGPFKPTGEPGAFSANEAYPEGRPYADFLRVTATDARGASRMLAQKQAHLAIGGSDDNQLQAPALYATYLAFNRRYVAPDFRAAVESALDRKDLTRFFVKPPALPMPHLLPPALYEGPDRPASRPPPPARYDVSLAYDLSVEDHRAVAERLQLKLLERGYRVSLRPLTRQKLRAAWASGDYDLLLHSLLLPPVPGPALAIVIDAAGRRDLLAKELPPIGAIADPNLRDQRARELADALREQLDLVPLYAQALRVTSSPELLGLSVDAQGLPSLDGAFLGEPR